MKIWPFLFAASPALEYRFVIQPDFIEGEQEAQFRERLALEDADKSDVRTFSIVDSNKRPISCFYRAGPLLHDGEVQTDSVGRKLYYASGFFSADQPPSQDSEQLIDRLTPFFDKSLVSFLGADRGVKPVIVPGIDSSSQQVQQALGSSRQEARPTRASSSSNAILNTMLGGLLVVSIGLCGFMFFKNRELAKRIIELESAAAGGVTQRPEKSEETVKESPKQSKGIDEVSRPSASKERDDASAPPPASKERDDASAPPRHPKERDDVSALPRHSKERDDASVPPRHSKERDDASVPAAPTELSKPPDETSRSGELPKNINP